MILIITIMYLLSCTHQHPEHSYCLTVVVVVVVVVTSVKVIMVVF